MLAQAAAGKPVKVAVPKSRKRGISTFAQAWNWFRAHSQEMWKSMTVAHQSDATTEIFRIAHTIHRSIYQSNKKNMGSQRSINFGNGSTYRCMTAMGNFGASGSDTFDLHVSEAALMESKSNQDAENLAAMINSMPQGEAGMDTTLILEGTGNGPFGVFAKICQEACKEESDSDYAMVFISWLEDPDLTDPTYEGGFKGLEPLTEYETFLRKDLGATAQQLMWRRKHIATHHPEWVGKEGNPPIFGYHYPATLAECFSAVAGAIYPAFSERHKRSIDLSEGRWDKYRSIDWGWQGDHAFVCLKVAHDPTAPPGLTIDPDKCPNLINEMVAYCVDAKTGQPKKEHDDGPSALRYLVVTMKLKGRVHVYDEMYIYGAASIGPTGVARKVHEWCGWQLPRGVSDQELGLYAPLTPDAENFCTTVADSHSGQNSLITQFCQWGIPTIGSGKPDMKDNSRGEIWDGINEIQILLAGDANFSSVAPDKDAELRRKAIEKSRRKRPLLLEDREAQAIRSDLVGTIYTPVRSFLGDFY